MKDKIVVKSPAKINLTLEVLNKRLDGYHNIDSIVQTISIFDHIHFERNNRGELHFSCNDSQVPQDNSNLIIRACERLLQETGIQTGVSIALEKNIPMQAGLGGGSSNAASTLIALNLLFDLNLSSDQLIEIGSSLGSDVALFINSGTVRMTGRGEIVKTLPDAVRLYFMIIKPECSVSTAWAYQQLDKEQSKGSSSSGPLESAIISGVCAKELLNLFKNDFQLPIMSHFSEIADAQNDLYRVGADKVLLAGSGSAVAGIYCDAYERDRAYERLSNKYNRIWACESLPADSQLITECVG